MKALFALIAAAAAISTPTTPAAPAFITDTLGGNGHAAHTGQSAQFITDTLGGDGHVDAIAPFTTDTLAPGGGTSDPALPVATFSWAAAGAGAGVALTAAAAVMMLLALRKGSRHHAGLAL
jgi:hypothetical protein